MVLFSLLVGLTAADNNWAMVAVAFLLYRGIPALITLNKSLNKFGFAGQRGIVFVAVFVVTFLFMQADKVYAKQLALGVETPKDQLITRLAQEAADEKQPFLAASEWPAQTMILCKRDVVRLPPAREKAEEFAAATAEEMGLPEKENDLWFDEEDAICVSLSEETIA